MKLISTKLKNRLLSFVVVFICSISRMQAQTFDEDVLDNLEPEASIDHWVFPMLLLGIIIMYYFYKKHQRAISN